MNLKFLFFFSLLLVVALFSVQNAGVVRLHFLHWEFAASQALVIFLSAFIGVAMGAVSSALARRMPPAPPATNPRPAPTPPPSNIS